MKDSDELALFRDLHSLLKKYGVDSFVRLTMLLRDQQTAEMLASALDAVIAAPRASRRNRRNEGTYSGGIAAEIEDLRQVDARKHEVIEDLYHRLKGGALLQTLAEIRSVVARLGLPPIQARNRETAVRMLMREFIRMPREEIEAKVQRMRGLTGPSESSLAAWSDVILRDHPKGSAEDDG